MSERSGTTSDASMRQLRNTILVALFVAVALFTGVMLRLVTHLSDHFGPQVHADLEWRALRGATELSHTADLGIAVGDEAMVREAFAPQVESSDVMGVVAMSADGTIIASYGRTELGAQLFTGQPGTVVEGPGVLTSWAPTKIEGAVVGKIGIVISTARLAESEDSLSQVAHTTMVAGVVVLIFGVFGVLWFIRAVSVRDSRLREHAATLEQRVEQRTRELDQRNGEMRLVLDNVAQGLITIDSHGKMGGERSAILRSWFGPPPESGSLIDYFSAHSPELAMWTSMGLDMLRDDVLPVEVILDQMSRQFRAGDREMRISFIPIAQGGKVERLLTIVSDVTEQMANERAEKEQREILAVFQRVSRDRAAGKEFLDEARDLLAAVAEPGERVLQARAIHTLKGNCGLFGFARFAELCHAIETELADREEPDLDHEQCRRMAEAWEQVEAIMRRLIGNSDRTLIDIDRTELLALAEHAARGARSDEIARVLSSWLLEPVAQRFERLGEQASVLAARLGKGELSVSIEDHGIRLDASRWSSLWAALVHAVRNSVDHGIESTAERAARGKGAPTLTFAAARAEQTLVLSLADDGAGIDWDKIRARASAKGLPSTSHHDLVAALFVDGVSSRDETTELSGRGVGLAALLAVVRQLGGSMEVASELGRGTRFEMRFHEQPTIVVATQDAPRLRVVGGGKE